MTPLRHLRARAPLLVFGAAALVCGTWQGLARLGAAPVLSPRAVADHGLLMVGGFLGTLIALERAVAAARTWAYAGPAFCALGVACLLAGLPGPGALCVLLGSAVVALVMARVTLADPTLHHGTMAASALFWVGGNALLVLGRPVFEVAPLWAVFLVGTISGERLELTRLLPRTAWTKASFVGAAAHLGAGAAAAVVFRDGGMRVWGLGALGLCVWLLRYDVARRTVRQEGQVRYIALSLLCGYAWLGAGGLLALWKGHPVAGPYWDALLHAVFVGFVFSMIFGHALVILPAVLGIRVEYRRRFYLHLGLLHLSVAVRLAGDLGALPGLRQAGAWLNVLAILLFAGSTALAARRRAPPAQGASQGPVRSLWTSRISARSAR